MEVCELFTGRISSNVGSAVPGSLFLNIEITVDAREYGKREISGVDDVIDVIMVPRRLVHDTGDVCHGGVGNRSKFAMVHDEMASLAKRRL